MRKHLFQIFLGIILLPIQSFAQITVDEAAKKFAIEPEVTNFRLSPEGDKLLMLQMYQGQRILVTRSLVDPSIAPIGIPMTEGDYIWADWATNDRIVAGINHDKFRKKYGKVFIRNSMVSLDWTGENQINLAKKGTPHFYMDLTQGHIVNWLKDEPDHVLVVVVVDLYKLNIKTNEYVKYYGISAKDAGEFHVDRNGELKYISGRLRAKGNYNHDKFRLSNQDEWQNVFETMQNIDKNPAKFKGFSNENGVVYVSKYDENQLYSLYQYDVIAKKFLGKVVEDNKHDLFGFDISDDGHLRSYQYFDERKRTVYIDEVGQRIESITSRSFPQLSVSILTRSDDNKMFIIQSMSPSDPGSYYLLDLNSNKLELIDYIYKDVVPENLSSMSVIRYTTRDGIEIEGFLSSPKPSEKGPYPAVIYPHDGPMAANEWQFDPMVQFLTSQGYAVLQMNYRGSTGYGKKFTDLAIEEWGNKVLEDINDGTKWLISQGIVDPSRICIYGENYAGYAALQSVVEENSLYKCSASNSPHTDLFPKYNHLMDAAYEAKIGDLLKRNADLSYFRKDFRNFRKKDHWGFDDVSPLHNIDKLGLPVLLMHDDKEYYDIKEQYNHFYDEMVEADREIQKVDFSHERYEGVNREVEKYRVLGNFLAKHLSN